MSNILQPVIKSTATTMNRAEDSTYCNIFFAVLSLLGALVNLLLLLCIVKNPLGCFRNSSSYFVAHQAFSDLATCSFVAGYYLATFHDASRAVYFPTIIRIFLQLCETGFIALFLVSLDRFTAIRYPIRYRIHVKPYIVPMIIGPIWFFTALAILLILFTPEIYVEVCSVSLTFTGILVCIKLFLHCSAFSTMRRKNSEILRRNSESSDSDSGQLVALKREGRFLLTVFIITVVVFVTIVPFIVHLHVYDNSIWDASSSGTGKVVYTLYWLGAVISPTIYFIRLRSYHRSLKAVLCFCCN